MEAEVSTRQPQASIKDLLNLRDFRLLWLGEGISLLGDQFYFIALPWLVLQITGDPLVVGGVLAVAGVPRTIFMLVGGALSDRFTPRSLMLVSNILRMLLVSLLAVLILLESAHLWIVYLFALSFGLVDAFFYPASAAIVPRLVDKEALSLGNMVIQGTAQLTFFLGPALAGLLIAIPFDNSSEIMTASSQMIPDGRGLAWAFGIDACTFLVSIVTLGLIRIRPLTDTQKSPENLWQAIQEGILSVRNDPLLRVVFLVAASITLLFSGLINVGVPVLADSRYPEGAAAFGILMSAFGGGSLLGMLIAGIRPLPKHFSLTMLGVIGFLGIGLAAMPFIWHTLLAVGLMSLMGTSNGYVSILVITWIQNRTPPILHGRMMSLIMFASLGMLPVANALAGVLIGWNASVSFVGAGILLTVIILASMMNPSVQATETSNLLESS